MTRQGSSQQESIPVLINKYNYGDGFAGAQVARMIQDVKQKQNN